MQEKSKPKCPRCGNELVLIYFMGDRSQPPEFAACRSCCLAYDPNTLDTPMPPGPKPSANVIF